MARAPAWQAVGVGCDVGRTRQWLCTLACSVLAVWGPISQASGVDPASQATLKRVLILQSFGSDFAPYNALSATFRSELALSLDERIEFREISVHATNSPELTADTALAVYVQSLSTDRPPDLAVAVGGQAARFVAAHREHLFPATPVLFGGADRRFFPPGTLTPNDAAVPTASDASAEVENILHVLPSTKTVAIVLGSSPLEDFWREELERELAPFETRVRLLWWNELSGQEILDRAADLPPRSAILYLLFVVDAAGIPHASPTMLARLHETASAPIFGLFETQLGQGIVGGPLLPISTVSQLCVDAAERILRGESPASCRYPTVTPGPPVYDWRELRRWGIGERDLPPGSTVRFRPPSPWAEYRWPMLGGLLVIVLQAGLLVGLLLSRSRLRSAEGQVQTLSRRLLTAFEDERRWIARELHDDVSQRLARLALDAARLEAAAPPPADGVDRPLRDEIGSLSADVHALSRRLHPSLLDNLGLDEALRAEVDELSDANPIAVELRLDELPAKPAADVALCLFRIAQESLRNIERHARASRVEVSLRAAQGGWELEIYDDGVGFDPDQHRVGLGLDSMRERCLLVGGKLTVRSAAGRGTRVVAWVPRGECTP